MKDGSMPTMLQLDAVKLTPETQAIVKEDARRGIKYILSYFLTHAVNMFKVKQTMDHVLSINERAYQAKTLDLQQIDGVVPIDELTKLIRVFRHVTAKSAAADFKQYRFPEGMQVDKVDAGGVPAEWLSIPGADPGKVFFYTHGGGWFTGSPKESRGLCAAIASVTKMRVFSPDYRLLPDHQHPAQIDDVMTAYKWLLGTGIKPGNVIVGGESAGAHLTLLLLQRLRDAGMTAPAGACLLSPPFDLSFTGESLFPNMVTDPVLGTSGTGIIIKNLLHHAKTSTSDPGFSPILGELHGFPPLLVQVSSSECLYSDATRLVEKAKAAGVDVTLQAWNGVTHAFQLTVTRNLPEAVDACNKIATFIKVYLSR
jgi:monoterpene epsilon-lactone hydrolase